MFWSPHTEEIARLRNEAVRQREAYAALSATLTERTERLTECRAELKEAQATIATMRREGFTPAVTVAEVQVPARNLPDDVQVEIDRLARPRSDTHRRLTEHAWDLVAGNVDERTIVQRLRYGKMGPPDDNDPVDADD
jgi:chromosome segregation ATPase